MLSFSINIMPKFRSLSPINIDGYIYNAPRHTRLSFFRSMYVGRYKSIHITQAHKLLPVDHGHECADFKPKSPMLSEHRSVPEIILCTGVIQPWEQELVAPHAAWTSLFVAGIAQWLWLAWHRWQRNANFYVQGL